MQNSKCEMQTVIEDRKTQSNNIADRLMNFAVSTIKNCRNNQKKFYWTKNCRTAHKSLHVYWRQL
jgi:hypothetical protein